MLIQSIQVLEARIPGTNTTVAQHPREDLGNGAKITKSNGETLSGAEAKEEAQRRANEAAERAKVCLTLIIRLFRN